jgi:uncharacterized protein (TIGR02452 family)
MAATLRDIAGTTLAAVSSGKVHANHLLYDISTKITESKLQTLYYGPDSLLSTWHSVPSISAPAQPHTTAIIEILETTTLDGARGAAVKGYKMPIGVLNFASADQPGGGFLNGANAQEESIARSSSLYASLMTPTAQQFYTLHSTKEEGGFYSHAMVYSPHVVLFRADDGAWETPMLVTVVTSPAVHAGLVRKGAGAEVEVEIAAVMRERMARVLFLFERRKVRNLVLGSFGTGIFQNDVDVVAAIWAELLCGRFRHSFEYVVFAVMDNPTYVRFGRAFENARKVKE